MVVDCHAHIFPFLGAPAGYPSSVEHLRWLQFYMVGHGQPVRRLRDHARVSDPGLADLPLTDPSRIRDVGFRVEENGRFVWWHQGEEVYMHFMPPSLQTNSSTAEYLSAEMAYCGVDVAVLQNAHPYGRLNRYFAAACARHPGRFIGLAEVDEARGDDPTQISALRSAVHDLGLRGLYYANRGFLFCNYRHAFDDPRYDPLWEEIRQLRIPVFWELMGVPGPSDLLAEVDRLVRWSDRYPDIRCVYTHGFAPELLAGSVPEPVQGIFRREQFLIEVLYPIAWGREHDYPYAELEAPMRTLVKSVGSRRLVWGSDMPNVLRHCTYAQSLSYLRRRLHGLGCDDVDAVIGGNVRELFDLG